MQSLNSGSGGFVGSLGFLCPQNGDLAGRGQEKNEYQRLYHQKASMKSAVRFTKQTLHDIELFGNQAVTRQIGSRISNRTGQDLPRIKLRYPRSVIFSSLQKIVLLRDRLQTPFLRGYHQLLSLSEG